MIREEVMIWVGLGLLVLMAFVLIPAYEGFKNAQGQEVDVDPNAPAMPDWLKPIDERTGKPTESFWNMFSNGRENFDPSSPPDPADPATVASFFETIESNMPSSGSAPPASTSAPSSTSTSTPSSTSTSTSTSTPSSTSSSTSTSTPPSSSSSSSLPPASTQSSNKPSGVTTLPSQSMPPTSGDPISLPDSNTQVLDMTLPPPNYGSYGPGGGGVYGGDKYVLKTSLQPCACAMGGPGGKGSGKVPGGLDSYPPTGDDAIKRPSGFQNDGNDPVGYLNSFDSFMK